MTTVSNRARLAAAVMRLSARLGLAEPEVLGLGDLVREGDHVFDIGAAYGMYTVPLAELVGASGRVHAFEPQPRQSRTVATVRGLTTARNVGITRAAIGADRGVFTLRIPVKFGLPIYGHAHVVEGTDAALAPARALHRTTPLFSVDDWCERHGVERVSFLKVDVEGFEPTVVEGAARVIERDRPSLLLEIEDRHLRRYGRDANAFADDLRRRFPEYRMYTWDGAWTPAGRIVLGTRNYLFATDDAFTRVAEGARA